MPHLCREAPLKRYYTKEDRNKRNKERLYLGQKYGYQAMVPRGPMEERIAELRLYLTCQEIAERAGVHQTTIALSKRYHRMTHIDTHNAIMKVRVHPEEQMTSEDRARGASRIIHGLVAKGFTHKSLTPFVPNTRMSLANLASDRDRTSYPSMSRFIYPHFIRMAEKLDAADPLDYGVSPMAKKMNMVRSRTRHRAPLGCWDLDTIHLEDATPDWTGACGTSRGYYLHLKHDLYTKSEEGKRYVLCEPCCTAKSQATRTGAHRTYDHDLVMKMYREGSPVEEICELLGARQRTIERIIRRYE